MDDETQRLRRLVFGQRQESAPPNPVHSANSAAAGELDTAYLRKLHIRDVSRASAQPGSHPAVGSPSTPPQDSPAAREPLKDVQRLRDQVNQRSAVESAVAPPVALSPNSATHSASVGQSFLERDIAEGEATALRMRLSRAELQLLEKLESRKQKRDAALCQPGGEQIAASYQREIENDEVRLAAFRRSEQLVKR